MVQDADRDANHRRLVSDPVQRGVFETDIPARLERLRWTRFHTLMVGALGISWVLDGLEVTIVGALAGSLTDPRGLGLTTEEAGLTGSAYIAGAVIGALLFGQLTDRLGRKRLFTVTVGIYLVATLLSGVSWNFVSFAAFRFLTGAGIGGEYAAINSAIQEMVPARFRGFTDLTVNGSYWIGAAIGAVGAIFLLNPENFPVWLGWRLAFLIGGLLALIIIYIRRFIPESPRWLVVHGRLAEAEATMRNIEARLGPGQQLAVTPALPKLRLNRREPAKLREIFQILIHMYPRRTILGIVLMASQAFYYNAIFFTYSLMLITFYGIPSREVGWFLLPFALGNFLGPLVLGRLFDTIGRKVMISFTYLVAGVLLAIVGVLFARGLLSAQTQTLAWTIIFFFASAGASAAYLTVGESFPLEARALVIAIFYSIGTAIGGIAGPALFGVLIASNSRNQIMWGYELAGVLAVTAAATELWLGVRAERLPLEDVAAPLSRADD